MCIGHTLGEEILFGQGAGENNTIKRSESVYANGNSCVLQLNIKDFNIMRVERHLNGGAGNMLKDYAILMYILESHFVKKKDWREAA
jgi:hypothetical protein